jgi:hypothetical protein
MTTVKEALADPDLVEITAHTISLGLGLDWSLLPSFKDDFTKGKSHEELRKIASTIHSRYLLHVAVEALLAQERERERNNIAILIDEIDSYRDRASLALRRRIIAGIRDLKP